MRRAAAPNALDTSGFLAPLVYPDYCLLWGATACGQTAAWALVVLRAALVYELTRSNAAIVHADGSLPLCAHHGLSDVVLSGPDRNMADAINYLRWETALGDKYHTASSQGV